VSAAHAQLVQVARALAFDCRVLVLDEPTTSLTDAEVAHLFGVLARLRTQGVTILFVSHRLPEVFALCSAITVLRDGRSVATLDRDDTSPAEVARAMVGRDLPARPDRPLRPGAPVLTVRGLSRPPLVRDVSFEIGAGEVVALFGLVGSGRTEVLETLFGLAAPSAGDVRVGGRPGSWRDPRQAMAAGLALVPEDRQRLGLHYNLSLADNLALARGAAGPARINRVTERARADRSIRELGLKTPSPDASPDTLSGGNQQKAVLGKWLATNPRVLLLDEPTQGVDVGAKFEIHRLIRDRAEGGTACLVASSDLPEVLALADRVLVMRQGRIVADLATADATEEAVMQAATHDEAGEAP
jgi:ABC-type sugar transport system ATPase subunit